MAQTSFGGCVHFIHHVSGQDAHIAKGLVIFEASV
jgi:hypothetical protein